MTKRRPARLRLGLAVALAAAFGPPALAQEAPVVLRVAGPEETQILVLTNGSELVGRIVEVGEDQVRFLSGSLEVTVPIADIRTVREASGSTAPAWFPNPNRTRLLFAPTARPLPRGSGYFASHLLFFPSLTFGVTDSLTVGGGVSLFPGTPLDEQLAFVTPKFGWRVGERGHVAAGALLVAIPGDSDDPDSPDRAGIIYSVGTWGDPDASVTAGFGYGYTDDGLADRPMVVLGGERRLSRRIAIVTENWMFPGLEEPLVSAGVRFLGERMSVDFAIVHALGEEDAWLPLLSFVFSFGGR